MGAHHHRHSSWNSSGLRESSNAQSSRSTTVNWGPASGGQFPSQTTSTRQLEERERAEGRFFQNPTAGAQGPDLTVEFSSHRQARGQSHDSRGTKRPQSQEPSRNRRGLVKDKLNERESSRGSSTGRGCASEPSAPPKGFCFRAVGLPTKSAPGNM